jgi:predicted lipoprotein
VRRSALLLVTAFAVGLLAAFAASCAGNGVKGGLPQSSADDLKAQISDVQEFVDRGDCDGIDGQLRQVQEAIDNLPPSTEQRLVDNLRQGADQLQSAALAACNERTETQETQAQETVTETIPTVTTTAPTTATTPPPTTTTTPPTQTTPTQPTTTTPTTETPTTQSDGTGGQGVQP